MRMICESYGLECVMDENSITEILFDMPERFIEFVQRLWSQIAGDDDFLILSEDDKELRLEKAAEIITDPFHIDLNNRKVLTRIYKDVVEDLQCKKLEELMNIQNQLESLVIDACEQSVYALTYDAELDFSNILKLYNVRIDEGESDIINRLISYVKLSHQVLGTKLFFFINLKVYLSEQMLTDFYQSIQYEKVYAVMIERFESKKKECEKRIIIDKDGCLIYNE